MKKWFREHIEPKRFRLFLLFAVLALVVYQGYLHMELFLPDRKYERQMVALAAAILGLLSLRAFWKMFRGGFIKTVMTPVGRGLKRAFSAISRRWEAVMERVRKALGLPDPHKRAKGADERTFLFRKKKTAVKRSEEKLQWKDLKDNRERLRFLYILFVKRQAKKGYRYAPCQTPMENGAAWQLKEEEGNAFFQFYTDARFAEEGERVSNVELDRFAELAGRKRKT
ncbi:MAG: hypothetical protein IJD10_01435 [Clostridia bacterium]|nr:hypothetical protein [Clostridia bacterium]